MVLLSPATARFDRMIKFSRYAEGGIGQYWIVDPAIPSVQVYDPSDGSYVFTSGGSGDRPVSIVGPVTVTVVPDRLVNT